MIVRPFVFPRRRPRSTDSAAAITALPHPLRQDFETEDDGAWRRKDTHEIAPESQAGAKRDEEAGRAVRQVAALRRYRYDEARGVRLKTVEIVVEEKPWKPDLRQRDEEIVSIHVAYNEKELRDMLKAAGGKWDPEKKVWLAQYGLIRGTELEKRILLQEGKLGRRK